MARVCDKKGKEGGEQEGCCCCAEHSLVKASTVTCRTPKDGFSWENQNKGEMGQPHPKTHTDGHTYTHTHTQECRQWKGISRDRGLKRKRERAIDADEHTSQDGAWFFSSGKRVKRRGRGERGHEEATKSASWSTPSWLNGSCFHRRKETDSVFRPPPFCFLTAERQDEVESI